MRGVETINPSFLREALEAKAGRNTVAVAGGTDILVKLHDVIDRPWPRLLVLDRIRSLHMIIAGNGEIRIGPLVTFDEIERSVLIRRHAPQLAEAAAMAGSVQIRNRATIGGNVANGSPAGDLIPPLYVLEARLELSSTKGKRHVAVEDFFRGPKSTILKSTELITAIIFRRMTNQGFYLRLATRRALAISKVSVAGSVILKKGNVSRIRIALGAVAPTVIRASDTEGFLLDKPLTEENIIRACHIAKSEVSPIDDIRSNAEYRREMVAVLLKRGLTGIAGDRQDG